MTSYRLDRARTILLIVGVAGYAGLPWYATDYGFWSFAWLSGGYPWGEWYAPAPVQAFLHGRAWLLPILFFVAAPVLWLGRPRNDPRVVRLLIGAGVAGLAYMVLQGFAIGLQGWQWDIAAALFGPLDVRQFGMGSGALVTASVLLFYITLGLTARGALKGDAFVAGSIGLIVAAVAIFIFYPVLNVLLGAVQDSAGDFAPDAFVERFVSRNLWGLGCLGGGTGCGAAWNSLLLAVLTGLSTTTLGLAFALIATRSGFPAKRLLRGLTVLPIITPPFVIGLAVILLFGRTGVITDFVADIFDLSRSRWIYGLPGIWFAQTLAFTPIAFLVLIGVVEGISPSLEEAAQTLRASRWRTFTTVSLPLMRPGLANAFLLGFIESLADFGNPIVLGGGFDVLATQIFFAIVGAQFDPGRAAVQALVLLSFTLLAFYAQRRWVGRRSYTTMTGKGDSGIPVPLPRRIAIVAYGVAIPWAALTVVIYGVILFGGFVELLGRNHDLTLRHYIEAFRIETGVDGLVWTGAAWDSFWTTVTIAAVAAPLTAAMGILTSYILARQRFMGRNAFEFGTMLSFAIPGTVIGISYILAFNTPPIELTGTAAILVICFIFRNMPVGVRAGVAAMSQIDRSLEEASLMLGARSHTTLRRVLLPLLRPAILAALVYSFVRAMTAVSAVIFLVSARYNMATSYILGRVENGAYGIAIAYASVLIIVMLVAVALLGLMVGRLKIRRREARGMAVKEKLA